MGKQNLLSISISILLIFILFTSVHSQHASKLVDKVCKQTKSYDFCINSLNSDKRTPQADEYTLAYIAFGLAYTNATNTQDYITVLIKKGHRGTDVGTDVGLRRCSKDYEQAVFVLERAYNDLNSETFFELEYYANNASHAASDCEAAFKGASQTPLKYRNLNLQGLCGICTVVAKLFTVPYHFN